MSDSAEQLCERAQTGDMTAPTELVALNYQKWKLAP